LFYPKWQHPSGWSCKLDSAARPTVARSSVMSRDTSSPQGSPRPRHYRPDSNREPLAWADILNGAGQLLGRAACVVSHSRIHDPVRASWSAPSSNPQKMQLVFDRESDISGQMVWRYHGDPSAVVGWGSLKSLGSGWQLGTGRSSRCGPARTRCGSQRSSSVRGCRSRDTASWLSPPEFTR